MSKYLNTGVSKVRSKPVSSHLLYRRVSNINHPKAPIPSTARPTVTTARKAWCIKTSKASVPWSMAILGTTRSTTGKASTRWSMVTTTVSMTSTYTTCPSISPITAPRRTLYSLKVQVRVTPLLLSPLSSLPSEEKLLQVTIPLAVLIVIPHLSPGRLWHCLRMVLIHLGVRSSPFLLGNLS